MGPERRANIEEAPHFKLEHLLLLPKPHELRREFGRRSPVRLPRIKGMGHAEYKDFLHEWEAHEREKEHHVRVRDHHRYLERLQKVQRFLDTVVARFDSRTKRDLLRAMADPAALLSLAKEEPGRFATLKQVLKPQILALLENRPVINTKLCSEDGVRHRKNLYYLLTRKGYQFRGNGEVELGRTLKAGPYRADQLYATRDGAMFVEVSVERPPASEFQKKLRLIAEAANNTRRLRSKGRGEEYPHLDRAWGKGAHHVAFYWGDTDLRSALKKIATHPKLAKAVRDYPHDVLLLNYDPRTHDIHAWSAKGWLRNRATGVGLEHELDHWHLYVPQAF
jgi:hypothetical protein